MLPAFAATAASFAAIFAASEGVDTVHLAERDPLILLVQSAKNAPPISDLLTIAAPIFERDTSFQVLSPERAGIDPDLFASCTNYPIACWHRRLASGQKKAPSVLLLGFFPSTPRGMLEVVAIYFDSKRAPPDLSTIAGDEALESALLAHAKEAAHKKLAAGDHGALAQYFRDLVHQDLNHALEENGRLQAFGDILLRTPPRSLSIELDGTTKAARGPLIKLEGVRLGKRALIVRDTSEPEPLYQGGVDVRAGAEAIVEVQGTLTPLQKTMIWSGAGVAAAGSILVAVALTKNQVAGYEVCGGDMCGASDPKTFASFCGGGEDCSFLGKTQIAPLGYSLILTGAAWILGELFTPEELAWLPIVVGIAGGIAAYGVSIAAE